MPCHIKNPANIDLSEIEGHVQDLYTHVHNKVGFNKPPTMVFDSDPSNEANVLGKTAYYDPNTIQIHIYTDGRHPKDMLRSIAHELIHHWQNEEGRLDVGGYSGPGYYLKNKGLKGLEDEAMTLGTKLFREYEDNRKLKERKEMSLNEWKNNELNRLLMKKFGILKESADYKRDKDWSEGNPEDFTGTKLAKEEKVDEITKRDDPTRNVGRERPKDRYKPLQEDSGEDQAWNDWKNEHKDDDHIKMMEYHLRSLKEDRDYERQGAEDDDDKYEDEGYRKDESVNPEDALLTPKQAKTSSEMDSEGPVTESLQQRTKKLLKNNKKLRLRIK